MLIHPSEIQERLRKRFLDRLAARMKRMRKELVERNWHVLKAEARILKGSGETFGFPELTLHAVRVEELIPKGEISRARTIPEAKQAVEELIVLIDTILIQHSVLRSS